MFRIAACVSDINGEKSPFAAGIAVAVQGAGAATQEGASSVQLLSQPPLEVGGSIGEVSEHASVSGTAGSQVLELPSSPAGRSERLNGEIQTFRTGARAA